MLKIQPFQPEVDETDLTDCSQLHDPQAGVAVMERNKEQSTLLHFVAGSELATFLDIPTAPLGLGSFDGLEKMPLKIVSSDGPTADPQQPTGKSVVELCARSLPTAFAAGLLVVGVPYWLIP